MRIAKIQNNDSRTCKVEGENGNVSRSQSRKSLATDTTNFRLSSKKPPKDIRSKMVNFH